MQKQNMTFIFFVAFLLIFFVCYLFVIGEQKEVDVDKKNTESTKKVQEEKLGDCNFEKMYNMLLVTDSDDEEYVFVTLKEFQVDEVKTVKIKRDVMPSLKKGNYYLFNFKTDKKIHDHIDEIFEVSELLNVKDMGKKVDVVEGICDTHLLVD